MANILAHIELENGVLVPIRQGQLPFRIGRAPDCDLCVPYNLVSRTHCELDRRADEWIIRDRSTNGTLVNDTFLSGEELVISGNATIVLGLDCLLKLRINQLDPYAETLKRAEDNNGIAIIDLCDSTTKTTVEVDEICRNLRNTILHKDSAEIVLLKNTGDGYLVVYESAGPLMSLAARILQMQAHPVHKGKFDLRVTLDAGKTIDTSTSRDRLGSAINRASRLEKTQVEDLEIKGAHSRHLQSRNRCLVSHELFTTLSSEQQRTCQYIGSAKFKGFGDSLHPIYQHKPEGLRR